MRKGFTQKEGNGNLHMVLRIKNRSVFTSEIVHHCEDRGCGTRGTYQDGRVVGHIRRRRGLGGFIFGDFDVLDIASPEDYEAIFILRRRDEFCDGSVFGAKRVDIFQRDG